MNGFMKKNNNIKQTNIYKIVQVSYVLEFERIFSLIISQTWLQK